MTQPECVQVSHPDELTSLHAPQHIQLNLLAPLSDPATLRESLGGKEPGEHAAGPAHSRTYLSCEDIGTQPLYDAWTLRWRFFPAASISRVTFNVALPTMPAAEDWPLMWEHAGIEVDRIAIFTRPLLDLVMKLATWMRVRCRAQPIVFELVCESGVPMHISLTAMMKTGHCLRQLSEAKWLQRDGEEQSNV